MMKIIQEKLTLGELRSMAKNMFGDMVKAVIDIDRELVAIDAELHSDLEALLLEDGSEQMNLWGINLYPDLEGEDFLEFDSMINIRPSQGNMSRSVDDRGVQKKIIEIVAKWIEK